MIYPVFRNYRHGHVVNRVRTSTYNAWISMRQACYNPNYKGYKCVGAKGILVCDEWLARGDGFLNFFAQMGERPYEDGKKVCLVRIDLSKNYCKDNCRWAVFNHERDFGIYAHNGGRMNFEHEEKIQTQAN